MCTRQDNFLLHLNLPCLMECKMPRLHGTTLLSAPRIFALSNCFRPGFLRTACPLSLSLPVSFTFHRRLTIHLLHPLADLFLLFLTLLLLLFLVLHSAPTFCSPPYFVVP